MKGQEYQQLLASIRGKDLSGLREEIVRLRREQFTLRMQRAGGELGQSHLMKDNRRSIALVKTVMTEKKTT